MIEEQSRFSVVVNFLYSAAYRILRIILPIVTVPYVSRVLGAEPLGVYNYTLAVATYFAMLGFLGFENYGNRLVATKRNDQSELDYAFCSAYLFQVLTGTLATILYLLYIVLFCKVNRTIALLQVMYVASEVFNISWLYYGLEQIKKITKISMAVRIAAFASVFVLVKKPEDVGVYTAICAGSALVGTLLPWVGIKQYIRYVQVNLHDAFQHAKGCLILFFPVLVISIYRTMDKIMLGQLSTMSQVAIYSNADKIVELPYGIIAALGVAMLPRMTNLVATGQIERSKRYIEISLEFMILCSCGMAFGMMAISKVFAPVFFGEEFITCGDLIMLIAPMIIIRASANVVRTQYLLPNHRDRDYITSILIGVVINLIVNALLIPHIASYGAAIGTLLTEVFVAGYQIYVCRKDIPVMKYTFENWPFIIAGLIMFFPVYLYGVYHTATIQTLIIQIGMGILIYVLVTGTYIAIKQKELVHSIKLRRNR